VILLKTNGINYRANPAITSCGANPGLGGVNGVLSSLLFVRS